MLSSLSSISSSNDIPNFNPSLINLLASTSAYSYIVLFDVVFNYRRDICFSSTAEVDVNKRAIATTTFIFY